MSLSSEEYREHLQSTSLPAGFRFDDVVLPEASGCGQRLALALSRLGDPGAAGDHMRAGVPR